MARLVDRVPKERRMEMDPGLLHTAERGRQLTLDDHADAVDARIDLTRKMNLFHETYDLLVMPAMPIAAFAVGQDLSDPETQTDWTDWSPFTYPFNLTGQPACVVPCGFTAAGLPVGMQIVGGKSSKFSTAGLSLSNFHKSKFLLAIKLIALPPSMPEPPPIAIIESWFSSS